MVPGGFRLVPARFRVGSGWFRLGSGRFRVGSAFYIHPKYFSSPCNVVDIEKLNLLSNVFKLSPHYLYIRFHACLHAFYMKFNVFIRFLRGRNVYFLDPTGTYISHK